MSPAVVANAIPKGFHSTCSLSRLLVLLFLLRLRVYSVSAVQDVQDLVDVLHYLFVETITSCVNLIHGDLFFEVKFAVHLVEHFCYNLHV